SRRTDPARGTGDEDGGAGGGHGATDRRTSAAPRSATSAAASAAICSRDNPKRLWLIRQTRRSGIPNVAHTLATISSTASVHTTAAGTPAISTQIASRTPRVVQVTQSPALTTTAS